MVPHDRAHITLFGQLPSKSIPCVIIATQHHTSLREFEYQRERIMESVPTQEEVGVSSRQHHTSTHTYHAHIANNLYYVVRYWEGQRNCTTMSRALLHTTYYLLVSSDWLSQLGSFRLDTSETRGSANSDFPYIEGLAIVPLRHESRINLQLIRHLSNFSIQIKPYQTEIGLQGIQA